MLILLSPAKSLDFDPTDIAIHSAPQLLDESERLIKKLKSRSAKSLGRLMGLSDNLAELNFNRYQAYETPFKLNQGAKQALLAFKGDVYREWPLDTYDSDDFEYAQQRLRILSGLYGALRPMDLIMPYRLEMGTALRTSRGKDLYKFWGGRITKALNESLQEQGDDLVINLASNEYFKSVVTKDINGRIISPVFKDYKNGQFKIISFFAKKARGLMAHYLIKNRIESVEGLTDFDLDGYFYDEPSSTPDAPMFLRKAS